jgi:hypothetical protein
MKRAYFVCLFFCLATTFLLSQSNPAPLVSLPLAPDAAPPGSASVTLTVNGAGFVSTSVVNWNGAALATTFVSSDKLVADVPGSNLASASTASVTVSNPSPGGGTSNAVPFTITGPTSFLTFVNSTLPAGFAPAGIVVADFNSDGKADLAVLGGLGPICGGMSGTISILLGKGDGTFTTTSTICAANPIAGLAGDFNHDGKLDLAVVSTNGSFVCGFNPPQECSDLTIYLGNGDGTFTESWNFPIDGDFFTIGAGDFNGDGNLDLAVAYVYSGLSNVGIFFGNGDGSFDFSSDVGDAELKSSSLAIGDFNNDGIIDIASVGTGGFTGGGVDIGPVSIFLGNGDGTFTLVASQPSVTTVNPVSLTTGDFNNDGNLDLAIADAGSTALTILDGNGDGTFTQVGGEPVLPQSSNFLTTADFNGDGKLDLVFSSAANIISIFLGIGDGTFQAGYSQAMDYAPNGVAVADFNGDGRLDLGVTNSSDNTVSILLQTPARPGATTTLVSGENPITINQPVTYTAVVWASPTTPTGSVTFKQGATILGTVPLANGQATFTTTFTTVGTFPIVASYSGDQNYKAKNSQTAKQVVDKYASNTSIDSNINPSVYGQAVNLTSQVTSAAPNQPTGTVTFKNGTTSLGTVPLVNGSALLTKTNLPAATLSITATYNGDSLNSKSTSPTLSQVVSPAITTTTVTSSPSPSVAGQNVKFKATVESPTVIPVGTVTFTAGGATLGQVSLAGGKASLTTSALPVGTTTVTATYNGTSNISASSGSVVQTVN